MRQKTTPEWLAWAGKPVGTAIQEYQQSLVTLDEARPQVEKHLQSIWRFFNNIHQIIEKPKKPTFLNLATEQLHVEKIYTVIQAIKQYLEFNFDNQENLQQVKRQIDSLQDYTIDDRSTKKIINNYLTGIIDTFAHLKLDANPTFSSLYSHLNKIDCTNKRSYVEGYKAHLDQLGFARKIGEQFLESQHAYLRMIDFELGKLAADQEEEKHGVSSQEQTHYEASLCQVITQMKQQMLKYPNQDSEDILQAIQQLPSLKMPGEFDIGQRVRDELHQTMTQFNNLVKSAAPQSLKQPFLPTKQTEEAFIELHQRQLEQLNFAKSLGRQYLQSVYQFGQSIQILLNALKHNNQEEEEKLILQFHQSYLNEAQEQDYKYLSEIIQTLRSKKDSEKVQYLKLNTRKISKSLTSSKCQLIKESLFNLPNPSVVSTVSNPMDKDIQIQGIPNSATLILLPIIKRQQMIPTAINALRTEETPNVESLNAIVHVEELSPQGKALLRRIKLAAYWIWTALYVAVAMSCLASLVYILIMQGSLLLSPILIPTLSLLAGGIGLIGILVACQMSKFATVVFALSTFFLLDAVTGLGLSFAGSLVSVPLLLASLPGVIGIITLSTIGYFLISSLINQCIRPDITKINVNVDNQVLPISADKFNWRTEIACLFIPVYILRQHSAGNCQQRGRL